MSEQLTIEESQTSLVESSPPSKPVTALADLRAHALAVPVDVMQTALQEYATRREKFREWLLAQLTEGLHYGHVPGTEPKFDDKGNTISKQWSKHENGGKGGYREVKVSPKSWKSKRCLYKAGAEFVVDLMGVRPKYMADVAAWQQLGGMPGNFVIKCELISRTTGEIVGEGIGARKVGSKGGDENNAVKMCQKSALVAAVLNSYGLSDLFTQDIDDDKAEHPHADQRPDAPKAKTRGERQQPKDRPDESKITEDELGGFMAAWKQEHNGDKAALIAWCHAATLEDFGAGQLSKWTWGRLKKCRKAFDVERGLVGGVPSDSVPF